jgi:hypothetical protein
MERRAWTTRLVAIVGATLLTVSVLSAAARSSTSPWSMPALPAVALPAMPALPSLPSLRSLPSLASLPRPDLRGQPARSMRLQQVPATQVAAEHPAVFSDDFSDDPVGANPPAGWTIADGRWDGVVADGRRALRHGLGAYGHVVTGSTRWTDYSVGAMLRPTALASGFAGVIARYQDRGNYYACGFYASSSVRLWLVHGGSMTSLADRSAPVDTTRFHDVRLVVDGEHLSCIVDGTYLLMAADGTFRNGRVALVAAAGEAAEFAEVRVVG